MDECLDDKRIKLSSSLLFRSLPEFANQSKAKYSSNTKKNLNSIFTDFKYPVHTNGYLSIPTTNGNHSSPFIPSFGCSAFAPTLPIHFPPPPPPHPHPPAYLLNDNRASNSKSSSSSSIATSSSSHRILSSSK
jgi:hypothetical protein